MKIKTILLSIMFVLVSLPLVAAPITHSTYEIKVKVDGLTCPFCAYGLEKKLKGYAPQVKLFVDEGYSLIQYPNGKLANFVALKKLIKKGGFTARDIHVQVSGIIKFYENQKWLVMDYKHAKNDQWQDHAFLLKGSVKGLKVGTKAEIKGHILMSKKAKKQLYPITIEVKS